MKTRYTRQRQRDVLIVIKIFTKGSSKMNAAHAIHRMTGSPGNLTIRRREALN
jgi:hypothetical protein